MSDRPIRHEGDTEVETPAPMWLRVSMKLTKEQLAAAERTREYHLRRMQSAFVHTEHAEAVSRDS